MKTALLEGMEFGAILCALMFLWFGEYDAVMANVAFAAYARYARRPA